MINGKSFRGFLGIPYAKPPVGNLRFKPPQKLDDWTDVRPATEEANGCRSKHMLQHHIIGDEDCLYLNVYVPLTSKLGKLPVMFWIHGGGFISGSSHSDMYGPDYFMDYDVILVTFNYRLGPLGFLNLDLEDCPGNVGLMDQVAALKWTKDNISKFHGDPENITIFGQSAGAASVHYLMLSDTTKNLFHKAIAQSGSALNPWAFQKNHVQNAFAMCRALGNFTRNSKEALEFLRSVPVDDMLNAKIPQAVKNQIMTDFVYVPSLEKKFATHEPFLTEAPLQRMLQGKYHKVPFITGFNDAEGIYSCTEFSQNSDAFSKHDVDFEMFVPSDLSSSLRSQASIKIAKNMKEFYFSNEPVSAKNIDNFVNIITDIWNVRGINDNVKLMIKHSPDNPIFYYEYIFDDFGFMKAMLGDIDITGACHGDELGYLFKNEIVQFPQNIPSTKLNQKRLLQLWTNFAKFENPTEVTNDVIPVKWEQVTKNKLNYLSIGNILAMSTNPLQNRVQFWENMTK
ncbi:venom carboxylesterase-6-like [Ctenocephalides felis]|uniref:venom carboxylesterase-6-like n=1 Tax=Ctenocephalides felis TaxID=7515 RepID=UPI000E6E473A|nr:venom carboxylesterase-6-like [Ctenocephalides felis]